MFKFNNSKFQDTGFGVYVHIPFCKSRCSYCAFYSTLQHSMQGRYVDALIKEMLLRHDYVSGKCNSVYIGGGTPSCLAEKNISKLLYNIYKVYNIGENAEITIECNPDDVDENFASFLKTMGINRVSMGAQTFSDNRLQFINRRHTAADVAKAVCSLRKSGIDNISIDLIFGFPCETIDEWEHDINEALALDVNHISAYSLTIEDDTPLGRMVENGDITEINEELSRSMYMLLLDKMADAGYEHYEISNFAKPYYRSRHNSGYWQQKPYIGLGAAAHSYDSLSRQWNVADLMSYINGVESGNMAFEREILDSQTMYNDIITTTMRTCEGVSMAEIESAFGVNYLDEMMRNAEKHIASGLLEIKDNRLRLTSKGLFLSDLVMRDLIIV